MNISRFVSLRGYVMIAFFVHEVYYSDVFEKTEINLGKLYKDQKNDGTM